MARFDVYANPQPSERSHTPYLLDVQNDYIDMLATRVVIPLRKQASFGPPARNLNPSVTIGSHSVVLDTAALGAVPARLLRRPLANVHSEQAAIADALDTLFGSF